MNLHTKALTVEISLSEYGDALIYGSTETDDYVPGLYMKQHLFAWHEASFYGTELTLHQLQDVELVMLPAELVIPFFADRKLLRHMDWVWGDETAPLMKIAPLLAACIEEKRYVPSFSAFQSGVLKWVWDDPSIDNLDQAFGDRIKATFSAAINHRYYRTEREMADLRSEYPQLLAQESDAAAGMDAASWLVAIGWKPDTAPFRPALQLLEPNDTEPTWRLKLVLQDKLDDLALVPVRLSDQGEAFGSWPSDWTAHIRERSSGWRDRLSASLPREQAADLRDDIFSTPLDDEAAWMFLTVDSQRLLQNGWQVLLPAWWEAASRNKPKLRAKISSSGGAKTAQSLFGLDSLIDFDWRIAIGDTDLTEAEFAELVARNQRLVRIRGQWISLDIQLLAKIRRVMASVDRTQGLSFQDVLQLHLLGDGRPTEGSLEEQQAAADSARVPFQI
ncbi:MAG: SNF2 helicase-associated domain-containing protein, partial [Gorillibacterium sp.]|nr:SNF2 helicase-associated domain-containing protein [Gorillibacterium sp.]